MFSTRNVTPGKLLCLLKMTKSGGGCERGRGGGAEVSFKKWVLACHRLRLLSLSRFFFRLKKTFFLLKKKFFSSLLSSTLWLHGFEWTFERDEKFNKWKRTSLTHTHTHTHFPSLCACVCACAKGHL